MSNLTTLLSVFASETLRIEQRIKTLYNEIFPKKSTEMIPDWETVFALPSTGTIEERRNRVVAAINARGGASFEYFYSVASSLGYNVYPVTTSPYVRFENSTSTPFVLGLSVLGDRMDNTSVSHTWWIGGSPAFLADTWFLDFIQKNKPAHTIAEEHIWP